MKKTLTKEQEDKACILYRDEKKSSNWIGNFFNVTGASVLSHLKRRGIDIRSHQHKNADQKRITESQIHEACRMYEDLGYSTRELGRHFKISHQTINRILKDNGIQLRPSHVHVTLNGKSASPRQLARWITMLGLNKIDDVINEMSELTKGDHLFENDQMSDQELDDFVLKMRKNK